MSRQILEKVIEEINRQPSRSAALVRTETGETNRRSKGKHDRSTVGALSYTTDIGWGVIEATRKGLVNDEWRILNTVRAPRTDTEFLRVARAMADRWENETGWRLTGSPDDERDRDKWEADVQLRQEISENLKRILT